MSKMRLEVACAYCSRVLRVIYLYEKDYRRERRRIYMTACRDCENPLVRQQLYRVSDEK